MHSRFRRDLVLLVSVGLESRRDSWGECSGGALRAGSLWRPELDYALLACSALAWPAIGLALVAVLHIGSACHDS